MIQDRFEELLGLLLDDDMSRDQLDELVEIVAADPLKLQRLREHLTFSDRLSQYEDEMRGEDRFLSALQVRAHAAEDTEDFVSHVVASINDETAGRRGLSASQHLRIQHRGWQRYRRLAGWVTLAVAMLLLAGMLINRAIDGGRNHTAPQIAVGFTWRHRNGLHLYRHDHGTRVRSGCPRHGPIAEQFAVPRID